MALLLQKIKVFRGMNTNTDQLDLTDNQSTDARNVIVSEGISIRPGFSRINSSTYTGAIVGLFDFTGVNESPIQSTAGYSRWLYSYIDSSNYLYFVNPSSAYKLYIARSAINQLVPTWELTNNYDVQLRTPVISGASYTGTATHWINGTTNTLSTHRFNKTSMATNVIDVPNPPGTPRATPTYAFSPVSLITAGGTTLYLCYTLLNAAQTEVTFYIDSMAADHTGYVNVWSRTEAALIDSPCFGFCNVLYYNDGANDRIQFCYSSDYNQLTVGTIRADAVGGASLVSATETAYEPINHMAFAYVTPNFAGFYLSTTDTLSHDLYFCDFAIAGATLTLGTTILDNDISFDMFDEQMNVVLNGTTLYVAYCKNNGEVRLGSCTTTGTGFSYETIATNDCHSAQVHIVNSVLYVTYTSNDDSGYKVNVYKKAL